MLSYSRKAKKIQEGGVSQNLKKSGRKDPISGKEGPERTVPVLTLLLRELSENLLLWKGNGGRRPEFRRKKA